MSVRFLHLSCEKEQRSNAGRNQKEYSQTLEHLINAKESWEHRLRLAVIGQVNYKKIEIQTLFLSANNITVKKNSQMQKIVLCKKIQLGKIRYEEKNLSDK